MSQVVGRVFSSTHTHPVHEELLLLIFARDHNRRHCCGDAAEKYKVGQRNGNAKRSKRLQSANGPLSSSQMPEDGEGECPTVQKRQKQRKRVHEACIPEVLNEVGSISNPPNSSSSSGMSESCLPCLFKNGVMF